MVDPFTKGGGLEPLFFRSKVLLPPGEGAALLWPD